MEFEWDTAKEASNFEKHGISFVAAAELLDSKHYATRSDRQGEERYFAIGELHDLVTVVIYTKREGKYRIISARRASKNEEATYRAHS